MRGDLAGIERLCKRIIVIDHGRIVHDGNLDQLRAQLATERTMTVDFEDVPAIAGFSGASGRRMVEQTGPRLRWRSNDPG
jgi:ABC-2 type transport system ATP-binding protein